VAADRAVGPGPLHAAGGAGESLRRARAGHRADDGRGGGDGAAGAGAVRRPAALLHRGADGGKCQGMTKKSKKQKAKSKNACAPIFAFCFLLFAFSARAQWTALPSDGVTM